MTLRRTCREIVLEVVLRRALTAEPGDDSSRLQLIVDEATLKVLNSFLRMGDLHSEGVTSMELLSREREPLPGLNALYLLRPDAENISLVLEDFKSATAPQHRHVHLCFSQPVPADLLTKLVEHQLLASRIRSLVEAPLSFVVVQDRGFHFDMPEAIAGLFPVPDQSLQRVVVKRLLDACRCLQLNSATIRHSQSALCRSVAKELQSELEQTRLLTTDSGPPCELLILDRSVDMAAVLVHEYTYEACVYDLLDGGMLDVDRHVVTLKGSARELLLSETDPIWESVKHLHIESAKEAVELKVDEVRQLNGQRDVRQLSTAAMLDMLRSSPEQRDTIDRLNLHLGLITQAFVRLQEEKLTTGIGLLEQDIACGVDRDGKDAKAVNLQSALTRAFAELEQRSTSESRLRLLMLYFACLANVSEVVRPKLIEMAKLDASDQQVLMAMVRSKLMEVPNSQRHKLGSGCVHRVTKDQAARFKRNARTEHRLELSRFEPRLKAILEQLAEKRLSDEDFPALPRTSPDLRGVGATVFGSPSAPAVQAADDWSFAGASNAPTAEGPEFISRRVVAFVLGGMTYSELRSAVEVQHSLSQGTEVIIGATSLLTTRRLIKALRPQTSEAHPQGATSAENPFDLT